MPVGYLRGSTFWRGSLWCGNLSRYDWLRPCAVFGGLRRPGHPARSETRAGSKNRQHVNLRLFIGPALANERFKMRRPGCAGEKCWRGGIVPSAGDIPPIPGRGSCGRLAAKQLDLPCSTWLPAGNIQRLSYYANLWKRHGSFSLAARAE